MSEAPVFVVVGNVNRGKSSVVSTLAADERVVISPTPGTTVRCQEFPMRVNGQLLYTLIDSPGFERARAVLAWLEARQQGVVDRRKTVEEFVAAHPPGGEYAQEVELLRPILDGAAVLYVVDGSKPFGPRYEAEMEILRWTGAPRMALINRVETDDHTAEWRSALDQYFNMVREFNPHQATFEERIALLVTLRELRESWGAQMDRAIAALRGDRDRALGDSAAVIADMLVDMLTLKEKTRLPQDQTPTQRDRDDLAADYRRALAKREARGHDQLRRIYNHDSLEVESDELELDLTVEEDLFAEDTWSTFGVKTARLVGTAASAGALTGGAIDASVGGASAGAGFVLGGILGGAGALFGAKKLPKVIDLGRTLEIGPMKSPQFPWVVLNRAIRYHDAVAERPHAKRTKITLTEVPSAPVTANLQLAKLFKRAHRDSARRDLSETIAELLRSRRRIAAE